MANFMWILVLLTYAYNKIYVVYSLREVESRWWQTTLIPKQENPFWKYDILGVNMIFSEQ